MTQKNSQIYLDYNATTPMDERVLGFMLPFFREKFGNSMSRSHEFGWQADSAVESSRDLVASLLGCSRFEITWTSGATEANNWAIKGLVARIRAEEGLSAKIHILSSPVEHASVLESLKSLTTEPGHENIEIEWLPVTAEGCVQAEEIAARIRQQTRLVICMWGQNEVGSINPIAEIGQICRERKVYFLTDATQALGKVPVHLDKIHVDLLSFSAHKLYGPKGVGFLYRRHKNPVVTLSPLIHGGGHERGLRSGTVNTPGVVGLAQALRLAVENLATEQNQIADLRDCFWRELKTTYPDLQLNGPDILDRDRRLAGNLNVTFRSQKIPAHLPGLAFSRGSACDTEKTWASHVLSAMGLSAAEANRSLRFGLGRFSTQQDITQALEIIKKHIKNP